MPDPDALVCGGHCDVWCGAADCGAHPDVIDELRAELARTGGGRRAGG